MFENFKGKKLLTVTILKGSHPIEVEYDFFSSFGNDSLIVLLRNVAFASPKSTITGGGSMNPSVERCIFL